VDSPCLVMVAEARHGTVPTGPFVTGEDVWRDRRGELGPERGAGAPPLAAGGSAASATLAY